MCKFICKLIPYCDTSDETDTLSLETSSKSTWPTNRSSHCHSFSAYKGGPFFPLGISLEKFSKRKTRRRLLPWRPLCSLLWPVFWWLKFQVDKTAIKFIISKYLIIPFSQLTKTGLSWRTPMTRSWIGTRTWRSTIAWRSLPSPKDVWGLMPTTAKGRVSDTSSPVPEDVNMGRVGPGLRIIQSRLFMTTGKKLLTSIWSWSTTGSDALPRRKEIPTVSTVSWKVDLTESKFLDYQEEIYFRKGSLCWNYKVLLSTLYCFVI